MTLARNTFFRPSNQGIYHITSKTVRGQRLLGYDPLTQQDYSHRRDVVVARILELAKWFAIDLISFAVMINHLHLILRNLPRLAQKLTKFDVIYRAAHIFPEKFRRLGVKLANIDEERIRELARDKKLVKKMRKRLSDISWYMRQLKQVLSRQFNAEDDVKGAFWASRFFSREVKGEPSLLTTLGYVDLNETRALDDLLPEESLYSGIGYRVAALKARGMGTSNFKSPIDAQLIPINIAGDGETRYEGHWRATQQGLFDAMTLKSYLQLLDTLGRRKRKDKVGSIPKQLVPILERIGIGIETLVDNVFNFEQKYRYHVSCGEESNDTDQHSAISPP